MTNKEILPVKEGDVLFCIKETEDLVLHALYRVKGAEEIGGDIILALETGDGYLRHASIQLFQGFCPSEGWDMDLTLNDVMETAGYGEMMNNIHSQMDLIETLGLGLDLEDEDEEDWDDDDYYDYDDEPCACIDCPDCAECQGMSRSVSTSIVREKILDEAKTCVCGDREQDYGSPESNFQRIADLWSIYTGTPISAVDVAAMLALLKIARIASGNPKRDNWVDLAGYAACGGEIEANS